MVPTALTTLEPESPYANAGQKRDAADFGMWIFLATETLFFGVLFFVYLVARLQFPDAFAAAGRHTDMLFGTLNTAVLLTSSLTMALAVGFAGRDSRRASCLLLGATVVLGAAFLAVKGIEYRNEYLEHLLPGAGFRFDAVHFRGAQMFFWLYFVMTGFHAVHLVIGMGIVSFVALRLWRLGPRIQTPESVAITGLYWHFVDIVWIFLYPCLYLIARS